MIDGILRDRFASTTRSFADRLAAIGTPSDKFQNLLEERMNVRSGSSEQIAYTYALPANWNTFVAAPVEAAAAPATVSSSLQARMEQYDPLVQKAAEKYDLSADLIHAVIRAESYYNPTAVSGAGAQGLMQLMPGTAASLGVSNSFDPAQNIDGGANYLRQMLDRFGGDLKLALAAYNCGPNKVSSLNITSSANVESYVKLSSGVRSYVNTVLAYSSESMKG